MPGRFDVQDTFALSSRCLFVAHGSIAEGSVAIGEWARVPGGFEAPVAGVEFVLLSATEGRENPALCFRYRDAAELARWQAFGLAGRTLEVAPPGPSPGDSDRAV